MALDRDAERVLEMVRLSGRPPYETLSTPKARELFLAAREVPAPDQPAVAETRALSAPGPAGSSAIWRPTTASAGISPMRGGASSSRSITGSLLFRSIRLVVNRGLH